MALRFELDRHHYVARAIHARAWLTMREQFGLAPNTLTHMLVPSIRTLHLWSPGTRTAKQARNQMSPAGSTNHVQEGWLNPR